MLNQGKQPRFEETCSHGYLMRNADRDLLSEESVVITGVLAALAALRQELDETLEESSLGGPETGQQADLSQALHHLEAAYRLLDQLL